ncbi:MAG: hypothetical protein AAFY46_13060 [Planctomycetota bacterium]
MTITPHPKSATAGDGELVLRPLLDEIMIDSSMFHPSGRSDAELEAEGWTITESPYGGTQYVPPPRLVLVQDENGVFKGRVHVELQGEHFGVFDVDFGIDPTRGGAMPQPDYLGVLRIERVAE